MTVLQFGHELEPRALRPRLAAAAGYVRSRAALGSAPETERVAAALESLAAMHPHAAAPVRGTMVRILRAQRYAGFPALRLYYSVDAEAVRLLRIEHYDPMEP